MGLSSTTTASKWAPSATAMAMLYLRCVTCPRSGRRPCTPGDARRGGSRVPGMERGCGEQGDCSRQPAVRHNACGAQVRVPEAPHPSPTHPGCSSSGCPPSPPGASRAPSGADQRERPPGAAPRPPAWPGWPRGRSCGQEGGCRDGRSANRGASSQSVSPCPQQACCSTPPTGKQALPWQAGQPSCNQPAASSTPELAHFVAQLRVLLLL
jgi:hypothetical protein